MKARSFRLKLYRIIEQASDDDYLSLAYDIIMLIAIAVSIIPLMFVEDKHLFRIIEQVTVSFFIIDYIPPSISITWRVM